AKLRRVGHARGEHRSEAVGWDDVEAGAGKEGDRVARAIEDRLEDGDLAGDVDVVRARFDARVDHRRAGADERSGAVEDETYAIKGDAIERKRAPVARQLARERRDFGGVAAGEDGTMSAPRRFARDQFAGVAVRAVEEPGHRHIVHPRPVEDRRPRLSLFCRGSGQARAPVLHWTWILGGRGKLV